MSLHYFPENLTQLPQNGLSDEVLMAHRDQFQAAIAAVREQRAAGALGFATLPYANIDEVITLANAVAAECKYLVLVGIGGSDLGLRAVHRALNHQYYNLSESIRKGRPALFCIGDTTDPQPLLELDAVVDWAETIVVMVSKSGNTIEQMSTFLVARERVRQAVGDERLASRIITITDATTGTLREITNSEGYRSLVVPANVGGRFTVLTPVGLFPLAVVGVDVRALLAGAAAADQADQAEEVPLAATFALHQYLSSVELRRPMTVLMPYTYSMREIGFWFRQLWAESLGKKVNRQGETVEAGSTPIAAVGPTDQHSQVQLYMEGPQDKLVTFVSVRESQADVTVPEAFPNHEGAHYLAGQPLYPILLEEQKATASALAHVGRPSVHLQLDALNAHTIGELLYFFELATAYAGELWNVNAYDQPGVELGKILLFKAMGRPGY